jgi:hypothetical protein
MLVETGSVPPAEEVIVRAAALAPLRTEMVVLIAVVRMNTRPLIWLVPVALPTTARGSFEGAAPAAPEGAERLAPSA